MLKVDKSHGARSQDGQRGETKGKEGAHSGYTIPWINTRKGFWVFILTNDVEPGVVLLLIVQGGIRKHR